VSTADILDRALEEEGSSRRVPASVRALLDVAAEVAEALATTRLSRAEQERIYARSLAMLEEAVREQRRGWQRVLHLERPAPVLVGGAAALTLGAAAIGWVLLHGRRPHPPLPA
jgi:2-phosphoglycerate kinase